MHRPISARELKTALRDGGEIALLDVREEAEYFPRHLLFASCAPLGRLELLIDDLVPRRDTRIVLIDAAEGFAERAADRLASFGYTNLLVLAGGIDSWANEGFEVFSGMHVPSKAFGELVEQQCETPRMTPVEVKRRLDSGESILILDSRPYSEYQRQSIPGGIDCPGAELVYRIIDLASSPETLIVVNCAGRTRSIIGAQSLINAGVPNRVVALTNGTMGWHLAGLPLAKGADLRAPTPSPSSIPKSYSMAERVAKAAGVKNLTHEEYGEWKRDSTSRTLYVFDVRSPEEFEAGHLPDAISAPGGQLVQETDRYAATRHARIVLVDDTGVRARMTAAWLRQMGWRDVAVLEQALVGQSLATGKRRRCVLGAEHVSHAKMSAEELQGAIVGGQALVVDFADIRRYRSGHIPGAFFALRRNLPGSLSRLPQGKSVVLTSPDGALARLAAAEIDGKTDRGCAVLDGGTVGWAKAGLPLERGKGRHIDEPMELWSPYEKLEGAEAEMKAYLGWEIALTKQIERDGDADFRVMRPR